MGGGNYREEKGCWSSKEWDVNVRYRGVLERGGKLERGVSERGRISELKRTGILERGRMSERERILFSASCKSSPDTSTMYKFSQYSYNHPTFWPGAQTFRVIQNSHMMR